MENKHTEIEALKEEIKRLQEQKKELIKLSDKEVLLSDKEKEQAQAYWKEKKYKVSKSYKFEALGVKYEGEILLNKDGVELYVFYNYAKGYPVLQNLFKMPVNDFLKVINQEIEMVIKA